MRSVQMFIPMYVAMTYLEYRKEDQRSEHVNILLVCRVVSDATHYQQNIFRKSNGSWANAPFQTDRWYVE